MTAKTKFLSQEPIPETEIFHCHVSKSAQPKCSGYTRDTAPSSGITKKAEQDDLAWIETGLYGSTAMRQILEGNLMKRALTAHSITYPALSDLHMEEFLNSKSAKSNAEYTKTSFLCNEHHLPSVRMIQ